MHCQQSWWELALVNSLWCFINFGTMCTIFTKPHSFDPIALQKLLLIASLKHCQHYIATSRVYCAKALISKNAHSKWQWFKWDNSLYQDSRSILTIVRICIHVCILYTCILFYWFILYKTLMKCYFDHTQLVTSKTQQSF